MSLPTTFSITAISTTPPISHFYICPNGWSPSTRCDYYHDGQPATNSSTHALNDVMSIFKLSLLAFIVLRLLARHASTSDLIGLCLIVGGFLFDVGFRGASGVVEAVSGANASTPTTSTRIVTSLVDQSWKTSILEPAGGYDTISSGHARRPTALWSLSLAFAVLLLALITGHLHRCMPEPSGLATYRPLAGRLPAGSRLMTPMESVCGHSVDSKTTTTRGSSETTPIRSTNLGGTLALLLIALLLPMAFADMDSNPEVMKRSAQNDMSPIWITYYSSTTVWPLAVTATTPPGSGLSICTEADPVVCPIVDGRKSGMPPRIGSGT